MQVTSYTLVILATAPNVVRKNSQQERVYTKEAMNHKGKDGILRKSNT